MDDFISSKIRERLKTTHVKEEAFERRELRRLQSELTRKNTYLSLLYQDRLDGTITKDEYREKKVVFQRDVDMAQLAIDRVARHNVKYKEQGSEIIELLQGFKKVYLATDLEGKSKILAVMLDRVILKKDGESFFFWHEPFNTLFTLGTFINKGKWGESLYEFINLLRHTDLSARLEKLREIFSSYHKPKLCESGARP